MRYVMIAMLLCACASFISRRRLTVAEVEANYQEFYKEFTAGNYNEAKIIAYQKNVDRRRVVTVVTTAMWQKVILNQAIGVGQAKAISQTFQLDREIEAAFARKIFEYLVINNSCEVAADLVLYFDLGLTYADKAINCAQPYPSFQRAHLACRRPSIKDLQSKLKDGWIENFKQSRPDQRDYDSMAKIAVICSLTADQYADLFAIGIEDKQLAFALAILEKGDFKKTSSDYDKFIAMAVARFQCGVAAAVTLKYKLPDATVEALFLNRKCFGGNFREVDLGLVPPKKIFWFFDLSLQAQEYTLARNLVEKFQLADPYFDRIVDEAINARAFDEIIDLDPPEDYDKHLYKNQILERIMDLDEEWFVARYVITRVENWKAWIERAYLHALRRGAFELAADLAKKHELLEFTRWGIALAFDGACQAQNLDEAETIVRHHKLEREALNRVVLLRYQKNKKEAKKKQLELRRRQKRECQKGDDWCVTR